MPNKTFIRLDEDKKERVMRAAIEAFVNDGFEKTKVDVIAANAGVSKGSIYQYFSDKKELFLYCITWSLAYFMDSIDRQTPMADMDIFDYLLSGTHERYQLMKQEPLLLTFFTQVTSGRFGSLTDEMNETMQRISDESIMGLIETGKRKGTIRLDLDNKALLLVYQGVTEKMGIHVLDMARNSHYELSDAQFEETQRLITSIVTILKEGMGN